MPPAYLPPWRVLLLTLGAAAIALWVASTGSLDGYGIAKKEANEAAAAAVALVAFFIGYRQWLDARREATLEKFFERLGTANQWREKMRDVDPFTMFVFAELDNLEYVIEKYRLGFITPELACRALRTFESRCKNLEYSTSVTGVESSRRFSTEAKHWLNEQKAGYLETTKSVANATIDSCDTEGAKRT